MRTNMFLAAEAEATGCVGGWKGLMGGRCASPIFNDELSVMPLWSHKPGVRPGSLRGRVARFRVTPLAWRELLDDWLVGMHEDLTLVGPNWNQDMEGGKTNRWITGGI